MADPQDQLDLTGQRQTPGDAGPRRTTKEGTPWLGVYYQCCQAYGRIYKTDDGKTYSGLCPRCGTEVSATVGPGGTNRRMFQAG